MKSHSKQSRIPALSNGEWIVMKPFWEHGPLRARDLYAALPEGHGWAYKTVKTMVSRLVQKGALDYEEVRRTFVYRPVYTREEMTRAATQSFVNRVFDGALHPFAAHCTDEAPSAELEAIRRELGRAGKAKKEDET